MQAQGIPPAKSNSGFRNSIASCTVNDTENNNARPEEEVWTDADGVNVFNGLLENSFELRHLHISDNIVIRYKSYAVSGMTPLDMAYGSSGKSGSNEDRSDRLRQDQEFYDGTGTLVWLASKALVWALDQDVRGLLSRYLLGVPENRHVSPPTSTGGSSNITLLCELGCGTGLPGVTALLLSEARLLPGEKKKLRVIFTDNDVESLENCRANCQLNGLSVQLYSHHTLSWGNPESYPAEVVGNVDVILASDVLYDLKMIPPLFQTAAELLRTNNSNVRNEGGIVILSHVPRFCLPRDEAELREEGQQSGSVRSPTQAFDDLEDHIIKLAELYGLTLRDRFRPHEALRIHDGTSPSHPCDDDEVKRTAAIDDVLGEVELERLKDMHALIFVFQKAYSGTSNVHLLPNVEQDTPTTSTN